MSLMLPAVVDFDAPVVDENAPKTGSSSGFAPSLNTLLRQNGRILTGTLSLADDGKRFNSEPRPGLYYHVVRLDDKMPLAYKYEFYTDANGRPQRRENQFLVYLSHWEEPFTDIEVNGQKRTILDKPKLPIIFGALGVRKSTRPGLDDYISGQCLPGYFNLRKLDKPIQGRFDGHTYDWSFDIRPKPRKAAPTPGGDGQAARTGPSNGLPINDIADMARQRSGLTYDKNAPLGANDADPKAFDQDDVLADGEIPKNGNADELANIY